VVRRKGRERERERKGGELGEGKVRRFEVRRK